MLSLKELITLRVTQKNHLRSSQPPLTIDTYIIQNNELANLLSKNPNTRLESLWKLPSVLGLYIKVECGVGGRGPTEWSSMGYVIQREVLNQKKRICSTPPVDLQALQCLHRTDYISYSWSYSR